MNEQGIPNFSKQIAAPVY